VSFINGITNGSGCTPKQILFAIEKMVKKVVNAVERYFETPIFDSRVEEHIQYMNDRFEALKKTILSDG